MFDQQSIDEEVRSAHHDDYSGWCRKRNFVPSPLLVPLEQVSNSKTSHQFITILCTCCGHSFDVPVYCGYRFCPICSISRQNRVRRRLKWLINSIVIHKPFGIKHLTLTIANQDDLALMVKSLIRSFRRLRQRAYWKNHVNGGAFVIEITGRPGNWHAHIHCILEAMYMDWATLHKLWIKCSGGRGLYISRLPKNKAVAYLTKYLTKSDAPLQVMEAMSYALKGTRLFSPFGNWYAVNCTYASIKPACPKCNTSALTLCDFIIYGRFVCTHTKYT